MNQKLLKDQKLDKLPVRLLRKKKKERGEPITNILDHRGVITQDLMDIKRLLKGYFGQLQIP